MSNLGTLVFQKLFVQLFWDLNILVTVSLDFLSSNRSNVGRSSIVWLMIGLISSGTSLDKGRSNLLNWLGIDWLLNWLVTISTISAVVRILAGSNNVIVFHGFIVFVSRSLNCNNCSNDKADSSHL